MMPGGIGPGCLLQLCEIPVELADHECGSGGILKLAILQRVRGKETGHEGRFSRL
jgi:hypothetical protein